MTLTDKLIAGWLVAAIINFLWLFWVARYGKVAPVPDYLAQAEPPREAVVCQEPICTAGVKKVSKRLMSDSVHAG